MDNSVYANYPPPLTPEQQNYLVSTVKTWALHHGLCVKPSSAFIETRLDPQGVLATNAPVTLFPSPFPKSCFDDATTIQRAYNELYARISSDEVWLGKIIEELVDVDDFVANLWKVHLSVKEDGYVQPLSLGLFRSDYIAHRPAGSVEPSLKQVEFNTISSSFGGLSALVAALHTHLLSSPPGNPITYPPHPILKDHKPPENMAVESLASGLASSHYAYGPSKSESSLPLCILFIVQAGERNLFDQLELSTCLTDFHKIPVFRLITTDIQKLTSIPSSNPARPLIYTPSHAPSTKFEVTTIYLRGFYGPADYPDDSAWAARTHLERSAAIKCPSVLGQLSGCKKVQQVLADPNANTDHLTHFLPNTPTQMIEKIRATFAPQYDLSTAGHGRELALDPSRAVNHVLKPQREGGGNNIYRDEIPGFLSSMPEKDWKGWILMELIQAPVAARNIMLRSDGEVLSGHVISELGVFGTVLWRDNGEIVHNEQGGWLLRTKGKESDEGGVAAGFSSLDSLVLL
ncbi:glutathione synthetase [[Emmonsia] crescens]|uniref:Glutathione synthetase n=1 Tax=[Emmonsia] crescens TaxID=73230 RepID=A0A0G2I6Q8_9EURO|nr:glutathione synthetase [Emmonsia crescens UAMH 3008]